MTRWMRIDCAMSEATNPGKSMPSDIEMTFAPLSTAQWIARTSASVFGGPRVRDRAERLHFAEVVGKVLADLRRLPHRRTSTARAYTRLLRSGREVRRRTYCAR